MNSIAPVIGTFSLIGIIVAICAVQYQKERYVNDSCKNAGRVVVHFKDGQPTCIKKETIIEIK